MPITFIHLENFKSFEKLSLDLKDINIFIGANASGKSNFLQIFRFIKNIRDEGLENAIFIEGDIENLQNFILGDSKEFKLSFSIDNKKDSFIFSADVDKKKLFYFSVEDLDYELILKFQNNKYILLLDKLVIKFDISFSLDLPENQKTLDLNYIEKNIKRLTKARMTLIQQYKKFNSKLEFLDEIETEDKIALEKLLIPAEWNDKDVTDDSLTLQLNIPLTPILFLADIILHKQFNISVYDFDPRLSKKAIKLTGTTDLNEDGSNLAIVLRNIQKDKKNWDSFNRKLRYVLPFINKIEVQNFIDKSMIFKMREIYSENDLPAFLVSDGTIHVACLIIALFYQESSLVIIEEPETNIHPALIYKLSELIEKASSKKQIIFTTHNPEFIRNFDIDKIFLVSRNQKGMSEIINSNKSERIKLFLEEEIGLDQLFIDGLLG
ncbi:MAG TPA: AAA family ATPase [Methanofastidiosum sp.]|jgi:predicted ATPase|nr:AAA family ATPase [Methanofastidiosum sp.]